MYALMFLGRFQFYSSRARAEKEGAHFIMKHLLKNYTRCHEAVSIAIKDAWQQERYSDTLILWNNMIDQDDLHMGNTFHKALVTPSEIDKPFW